MWVRREGGLPVVWSGCDLCAGRGGDMGGGSGGR